MRGPVSDVIILKPRSKEIEESMEEKFIVIHKDDVIYHHSTIDYTSEIIATVEFKPSHRANYKYIVINTDEPYIDEIITILKQNGHWDD